MIGRSLSFALLVYRSHVPWKQSWHAGKCRLFSVVSADEVPSPKSTSASLSDQLSEAYQEGGSDGVLELAKSLPHLRADVVFSSVEEASVGSSGVAATMLNSFLASNCLRPDEGAAADAAIDFLDYWEAIQQAENEEWFVDLDMVTYSIAYSAAIRDPDRAAEAESILERGLRMTKKIAGSQRRKALVAQRRRPKDEAKERLDDLRSFLGADFDVLAETDDYVVVQKPAGVACTHRILTSAGKKKKKKGKNREPADLDMSLVDALLHCNVVLSTLNPESQGLVHRLDRGTSGCILLAKTDEMHARAVAEFYCRKAKKTYQTLVAPAPDADGGVLSSPVNGRPAKSRFRVVERFGQNDAALVEMETLTGRKHQVRVHAAQELSTPVLYDNLYGQPLSDRLSHLPPLDDTTTHTRFLLHAATLQLPTFGIQVESSLPSWWQPTMETLREL